MKQMHLVLVSESSLGEFLPSHLLLCMYVGTYSAPIAYAMDARPRLHSCTETGCSLSFYNVRATPPKVSLVADRLGCRLDIIAMQDRMPQNPGPVIDPSAWTAQKPYWTAFTAPWLRC